MPMATQRDSVGIAQLLMELVSFMELTPQEHICTFTSALDKSANFTPSLTSCCPGQNVHVHWCVIPSFVSEEYLRNSGSEEYSYKLGFYFSDALRDSAGCGPLDAVRLALQSSVVVQAAACHSTPLTISK